MTLGPDHVISPIKRTDGTLQYVFWCPGCKSAHSFTVPPWTYNDDPIKPTVRASILVRAVKDAASDPTPTRCHLFVTDGKIKFLGDCTHDLAGTEVDMMPFESV